MPYSNKIQNNNFFFNIANIFAFFFTNLNILCTFALSIRYVIIMTNDTATGIYKWGSIILIVAATAVFFLIDRKTGNPSLTLLVMVAALCMRMLMYRTKFRAASEENEELKTDLRRLTQLLKEKSDK